MMKRLLVATTLALSLSSLGFAAERQRCPKILPPQRQQELPRQLPQLPYQVPFTGCPAPAKTEIKATKPSLSACSSSLSPFTMSVVVWAAKKTKTAADFYGAGGGITGTQNGWAIAGDYMSAASFLGISGSFHYTVMMDSCFRRLAGRLYHGSPDHRRAVS